VEKRRAADAAVRLGATGIGVDIDPVAVDAARENAAANGLVADFSTTPIERLQGQYELVVANLFAEVLVALSPHIVEAVRAVPRVVADPGPAVQLAAFASDGLQLNIVFWIADPQNGQGNVLSDVNLVVLRTLKDSGVEIPFPQRVVRQG